MAATIMDGKALASKVKEEIRERTSKMEHKPGLAVVLVGDDPASRVYVNGKKRDCGECGIYSEEYALPAETSQQELLELEEMGLSFFSSYAQYVPCHMMESTRLSSMIAIGTDYTQNTLDAVRASAIDVLECSIQPGENYGTSMNYADILRYSDIAAKTAKPCVVPTQRRIRPEEVRHLAAAGCKAIMIGAVVMGGARPEDVKRATAAFRAAADAV